MKFIHGTDAQCFAIFVPLTECRQDGLNVTEISRLISKVPLWAFCTAALNSAAAVYLLSVLAGVSLLNEGEQDCHHPEDSARPAPRS